MWRVELEHLGGLTPAEQLWVIAQAVEENGGPPAYAASLRSVADRLEGLSWWLAETLEESLRQGTGPAPSHASPVTGKGFP
jgi:hypothetical protein